MKPSVIQIGIATKRIPYQGDSDAIHRIETVRNREEERKRSQAKFKDQIADAIAEFQAKGKKS